MWKRKREEAFAFYGATCNRCPDRGSEIHHRTYDNVFDEKIEDLEVLCKKCHREEHKKRKQTGVQHDGTKRQRAKIQSLWRKRNSIKKKLSKLEGQLASVNSRIESLQEDYKNKQIDKS
jgi:5-methylcytosine-specific restriction endonuclease McrA